MTDKPSSIRLVQKDFDPATQCGLCEQRQDAEEIIKELLEAMANAIESLDAQAKYVIDDRQAIGHARDARNELSSAIAKAEGKP